MAVSITPRSTNFRIPVAACPGSLAACAAAYTDGRRLSRCQGVDKLAAQL